MNLSKVTRIEVIDWTRSLENGGGRVFGRRDRFMMVDMAIQDQEQTLKIFLRPRSAQFTETDWLNRQPTSLLSRIRSSLFIKRIKKIFKGWL